MEPWNRLTIVRRDGEGGDLLKEGEGISQRTFMKDPWTQAVLWGLTMEVAGGLGKEERRENNWDICNNINNKN